MIRLPSLSPSLLPGLGLGLGLVAIFGGQRVSTSADEFKRIVVPILERHCTECHNSASLGGRQNLAAYTDEALALKDVEVWSQIRDRVVDRSMPPEARPALAEAERESLLGWIEAGFDLPDAAVASEPGRPVLRRLNHTEYRNTIRDLFGIDFPADELFPSENAGHGFDTSGDALSMPDAMFEKYLDAAETIADQAIVGEESGSPPRVRRGPEAFNGDGRAGNDGWFLSSQSGVGFSFEFPRSGEYVLRASAWGQQAGPEAARMQLGVGAGRGMELEVPAERGEPAEYEVHVSVSRGTHRLEARFVNDFYDPDNPDPKNRDRNLCVVWLEVEGPVDPPPILEFQRELFARFGEDLGRGRLVAMLEHLAFRAWRRPVTERELGRLDRLARTEESLEAGVRLGLTAILASPKFLFRPESDRFQHGDGTARPLDGFELATRLSYFLWSSTPDETLLEAARRGDLSREPGLLAELERMLDDPRARALADGFAAQWLKVRSLDRADIDDELFPGFDDTLRASMRAETLGFFDHLLREERSAWELIDGDYTFLDERLADHYGIEGVTGPELRRVSLAGLPRRGVLTQAAVLTLTSNPNRTSPVKRGKWIMETLLGTPPPPPPPGVEALDETPGALTAASIRERMELHRQNPDCAVCHVVMDPLGFGLENFDATGAWREVDGSFPIDATGELPDGRRFEGPVELVGVLREEKGFLNCLVENLSVYVLGRGLTEGDDATVDAVLASLDPEVPTLREMIEGIVLSTAFRNRSLDSR